ncbi:IclR family transcriptional regulator [Streptomyces sp. OE57]|uniref:IclR family transcriptional regulator n=1 Tax=Streptomyces lacaronensis TaxID=3379885 RepID=UPI0039B765B7
MAKEDDTPDRSSQTKSSSGLIGAVDNVLHLLHMFEEHETIRVNQVAQQMRLSRSTVHRLLATLSHHQFVEQDEGSRAYRPGPALIDIGLSVVVNIDIQAISRDALTRLRDETDETTHLACLRGSDVVYLDAVESTQAVRASSRVGWSLPAHSTAIGKAILAELPDAELAALHPTGKLATVTERTISTLDRLLPELAAVRERGYATNDGESELEVRSVAAVVRDGHGSRRAAIAVTAPSSRAGTGWAEDVAPTVTRIAKELSERIG